jgi:membrane associated rhomboid family serine protease
MARAYVPAALWPLHRARAPRQKPCPLRPLPQVNHLISQGELWRLLTPAVLHADLFHLGINSLSLYLLGPSVEAALGKGRFAAVYCASAVAGNALSWAMGSAGFTMAVGASSSISGLFGAYGGYCLRRGPAGRWSALGHGLRVASAPEAGVLSPYVGQRPPPRRGSRSASLGDR